jgi:MYXO-CTERM domain-containing protein
MIHRRPPLSALLLALLSLTPAQAWGFCGFYVSGADQDMFNDATQVVMMRHGTKTVLSMRNAYEGPPTDFAMVVPVPVVLEEENVKVLNDDLFKKVDALSAPRLVEYWEHDPCGKRYKTDTVYDFEDDDVSGHLVRPDAEYVESVKVEAEFDVGEYNVVILSARESNGLEAWLKQEKYNIPEGAAPSMKPYIEGGMYFFVAKVDPTKVTFEDGRAVLSPLRFHYDSEDFALPIRLGLLNARGSQDLIVNILAPNQRYEAANRPNVTIPTNLIVEKATKQKFGAFYTALFDYTLEANPGAVVTEYAWQATKCDPCPDGSFGAAGLGGALDEVDLMTLGGDVVPGSSWRDMVLTRLHARYDADDLSSDLIFAAADPIKGGRGAPTGVEGTLTEEGAKPGGFNNFQGRYVMLNPWEGELACEDPVRGRWGGPPDASGASVRPAPSVFAARGAAAPLGAFLSEASRASLGDRTLKGAARVDPAAPWPPARAYPASPEADLERQPRKNSCATTPTQPAGAPAPIALAALAAFAAAGRRRR